MTSLLRAVPAVLLLSVAAAPGARAQAQRAGCTLDFQDHYRCDRDAFQQKLAAARIVRVDTDRLDLFTRRRTQELLESLGKVIATPEQQPDLVFDVAPLNRSGRVELSPAAVALATLTVYQTSAGVRSRVWVRTLDGDPDRPWPTVVVDLLRNFQKDALTH